MATTSKKGTNTWMWRLATSLLCAVVVTACSDESDGANDSSGDAATDAGATDAATTSDAATAGDATTADATTPPQDASVGDATAAGDADGCAGKPKPAKTCCSGDVETNLVCSGGSWGCPSGYDMVSLGDCGKPLPDVAGGDGGSADAGSADGGATADTKTSFPWTALQVNRAWGPCPPGKICSESWHLLVDGAMTIKKKGNTTTSKMSADDLKMLKQWMAKGAFVDGMTKGFACQQPPSDIFISFELFLSGVKHTKSVTGCVLSGPAGNIAKAIFELVTKY